MFSPKTQPQKKIEKVQFIIIVLGFLSKFFKILSFLWRFYTRKSDKVTQKQPGSPNQISRWGEFRSDEDEERALRLALQLNAAQAALQCHGGMVRLKTPGTGDAWWFQQYLVVDWQPLTNKINKHGGFNGLSLTIWNGHINIMNMNLGLVVLNMCYASICLGGWNHQLETYLFIYTYIYHL